MRPGRFSLLLVFILCVASVIPAQDSLTKEEREDNLRLQEALIKLKEAREQRDTYRREYNMNLEFYKSGIVTLKELNESEQDLQEAELNYERAKIGLEKTRLSFLSDATRIEIVSAKKYLTEDGDRRVSVVLKNSSNIQKALASDPDIKKEDVSELLRIEGLKVSLKSGAIISDPYELIIDALSVGEEKRIDFNLLKDVQSLAVVLEHGTSKTEKNVFLRKESLREIPTIETSQGSQQGELGNVISYNIELEWLAEVEKRFNLIILGLPRHYTAHFKYNNATVSNIKFTPNRSVIGVSLELIIPEKLDKELVDRTVEFYVVVTKPSQAKAIARLNEKFVEKEQPVKVEDLESLECNFLRLDVTPTGTGEIELETENRYKEIKVGEEALFRFFVKNSGTLEVKNIDIEITPPFEWTVTAVPESVKKLKPGEKQSVKIEVTHGDSAGIGEYDIRLHTEGEAGYEKIESDEKTFTVKLTPKAKLMQNLILVGVLIAVVVIISIVSVIVSRQ